MKPKTKSAADVQVRPRHSQPHAQESHLGSAQPQVLAAAVAGMAGSRIPIATSHGEGRATFADDTARFSASYTVALRYVDNHGAPTTRYPLNPNGSPGGITGLTTPDGRVTIMMPHPERVALTRQNSWHPPEWGVEGPWMRMFRNMRVAVG